MRELQEEIAEYNESGEIILIGNFNAHTAGGDDFINDTNDIFNLKLLRE